MIPSATAFIADEFVFEEQPTRTYKMNLQNNTVCGYSDEQEAMEQAIFKVLNTERYENLIYSGNYGVETQDLFGQPISYVCPEIERRIKEALLCDSRIQSVENFLFEENRKGELHVSFTVKTIFGEVNSEKVVNF